MARLLKNLGLRIVLVCLGTTLCSFLAIDQPVLRSVYLALTRFVGFLTHLDTVAPPALASVWDAYWRSMVLLIGATGLGAVIGIPLGFLSATRSHSLLGRVAGIASYLGTLTPSFVFGLLIMVFFVRYLGYWTGLQWIRILPSPGLPEPREVIAPALTLAARPVAYIAQVTGIQIQEQLRGSYVQTAHAKGLRASRVLLGHVWPNVAAPVLGATRSSILFSLSSLPIVEYIFGWNGVGYMLFDAVLTHKTIRAAFLLASLGITFVLVTTLVDLLGLRLDPRSQLTRETT